MNYKLLSIDSYNSNVTKRDDISIFLLNIFILYFLYLHFYIFT